MWLTSASSTSLQPHDESSANQIAHEMDERNDEPQSVHVPHLRAIDEKSPFACDATVDPEAQSVPQAVHSEESLRVQDVKGSCQLASRAVWSTTRLSESNTSAVGVRSGLSCPQILLLQRERQFSNVDASLDLLFVGTSDVGRGRNAHGVHGLCG